MRLNVGIAKPKQGSTQRKDEILLKNYCLDEFFAEFPAE
jgi:hypothetical protein